jgi:ATP-dependent DNA ligase
MARPVARSRVAALPQWIPPQLTRTGLDSTHKYPAIAAAVASLGARQAYLDGELCGVGADSVTSFSMIQLGSDKSNAAIRNFRPTARARCC